MKFGFDFQPNRIWLLLYCIALLTILLNLFAARYTAQLAKETPRAKALVALKGPLFFVLGYVGFAVGVAAKGGLLTKPLSIKIIRELSLIDSEAVFTSQESVNRVLSFAPVGATEFLAPLVFFGSLVFSILGAVGAASSPVENVKRFFSRPTPPRPEDTAGVTRLVLAKRVLRSESERLISTGRRLFESRMELNLEAQEQGARSARRLQWVEEESRRLRAMTDEFEGLMEYLRVADGSRDLNPVEAVSSLLQAICLGALGVFFAVGCFCSAVGTSSPFERLLRGLFEFNTIVGLAGLGVLGLGLVFAALAGFRRISGSFPSILAAHPYRIGATWADSYLHYNTVALLSTIGILAYFARTCPQEMAFTSIGFLNTQVFARTPLLIFFSRHHLFEGIFLVVFTVSFLLALHRPSQEETLSGLVKREVSKHRRERDTLGELKDLHSV